MSQWQVLFNGSLHLRAAYHAARALFDAPESLDSNAAAALLGLAHPHMVCLRFAFPLLIIEFLVSSYSFFAQL